MMEGAWRRRGTRFALIFFSIQCHFLVSQDYIVIFDADDQTLAFGVHDSDTPIYVLYTLNYYLITLSF